MIMYSYTKRSLLFLSLIFFFISCTDEDLPSNIKQESFTLKSDSTGFKYVVNIGSLKEVELTKNYHVIYLLDGDDYYNECMQVLSSENREDIIIVSIGYDGSNERGTDYSYPYDRDFDGDSGGAKKFIDFLNLELLPKIEENYQISSLTKTIYGHSLGGYFALYVMLQEEQENTFDKAIIVSPNLMWYNSFIFDLEEEAKELNLLDGKAFYMAMGDLEGVGMNASFDAMVKQLKLSNHNDFNFNYEKLYDTSHRNSPVQGFKKGLQIIE
ncbi:putative alpha/beta superfamily hydrolase [Tenacibaculum gallaicum]|uniref:Putative alpha/beta superfamily hydrolase n=1 Tax=Tenacibaculum gallaicum TaxID=561505 RepID=A0A3E0IDX8_9FLAO|nr:alpha/beta hydrolase-fold protein [Tenacibaculum gallaicum]REH56597.1 putative alpha/beta superfamily hydrolase [Tenacibaculum gallaicum]